MWPLLVSRYTGAGAAAAVAAAAVDTAVFIIAAAGAVLTAVHAAVCGRLFA